MEMQMDTPTGKTSRSRKPRAPKTNGNGAAHAAAAPKRARGRPAAPKEPIENFTSEAFADAWAEVQDLEKTKSSGDASLSSFYMRQERRGMHRGAFQAVRRLSKKDAAQVRAFYRSFLRYVEDSGLLEQIEAHEVDLVDIAGTAPAA